MRKMKTAIVEDDAEAAKRLCKHLKRYEQERGVEFETTVFSDAVFFLFAYKPGFDCIFMDIDLPYLNGMDGAMKLREVDPLVPIVFITSLAQYAIRGYEASALDYLVKPYSYESLAMTLNRVVARVSTLRTGSIVVKNMQGARRISFDSIYYVEVHKHRLLYHTDEGVTDVWGSMPDAEKVLPQESFCKCGVSWLVNLRHVRSIEGNFVVVGADGDRLKISRPKKKAFIAALHRYIEGAGVSDE